MTTTATLGLPLVLRTGNGGTTGRIELNWKRRRLPEGVRLDVKEMDALNRRVDSSGRRNTTGFVLSDRRWDGWEAGFVSVVDAGGARGDRGAVSGRCAGGGLVVEFGVPRTSAARIRDADALARRRVWHSPHRLSLAEREEIFAGVCRGDSDSEIARRLGRHRSTIGREIRRCGGRGRYRPLRAERLAQPLARRPKATKLRNPGHRVGHLRMREPVAAAPERVEQDDRHRPREPNWNV